MASEADLWHTRAVGKCTRLGYKAFKVGGERFPVGPGTIMRVRFEWGAGEHKVEVPGDGTAPIRSYMLKKGDGQFGANIAFGWMLNYHHICSIDNLFDWFCDQARWVLDIMETSEVAKQHLYVDTNWLVSDGAECVVDNIMRAIRVPFPTPNLNGLDVGPNSIGILGRVDFRFTNHQKAPKVKGFLQYTPRGRPTSSSVRVRPPKVQMLVMASDGQCWEANTVDRPATALRSTPHQLASADPAGFDVLARFLQLCLPCDSPPSPPTPALSTFFCATRYRCLATPPSGLDETTVTFHLISQRRK